ncbi:MAG: patatin-like phospholipase family protein [Planctomycetes bacterium]|nr:patatin-like phospholipase family protein [Planctomycetota bacterium]
MIPRPSFCLALGCTAMLLAGCASARPAMTGDALHQHVTRAMAENAAIVSALERSFQERLQDDLAAGRRPTIDILALSGGADWGAYGAGFLLAWSQKPVDDPLAMPDFDLVTGISTGSLIAPYAALGRYAEIESLFRHSTPDWARSRFLSSAFSGEGLYDISLLEDAIYANLDRTVIPGLCDPTRPRRNVLIATADVDLGFLRVWDAAALARDRDRFRAVQRAAIAIPAAFDPVFVDGTLQADAGVLMQLIAVAQPDRISGYMRAWNQAHPGSPMRLRYWVIANNRTAEPPTTVQPTWHALFARSTAMMMKSGVLAPLTTLWLQSELLRREGLDVEFRWTAIPSSFPIDPAIPPFDPRITGALADLGRSLGAQADAWRTVPPSPITRPDQP